MFPEAPPRGSLVWFNPRRGPWYTWDDYRNVLTHLRETTGSATMVANVLKSPPFPALNGPTARLSPFRAESGICWMLFVDIDRDAEFAAELEQATDSVVVWAPDELGFASRLSLPRLTAVIREHYRLVARFGRIEIWRRVPGAPGKARNRHQASPPAGQVQDTGEPQAFVAVAGASNGRFVALSLVGQGLCPSSLGDPQEYAGTPDLIPRPGLAMSDLLKDPQILRSDVDSTRFATTHGAGSLLKRTRLPAQHREPSSV
jgi:hypothetical protein